MFKMFLLQPQKAYVWFGRINDPQKVKLLNLPSLLNHNLKVSELHSSSEPVNPPNLAP